MLSEPRFNIGDVSQQTGVATVTLRAWERRYGLIKPERTPKGHRLYKQANIDEIRKIVVWLNRGVAISKVAALLASNDLITQVADNDNHWLKTQEDILVMLSKLKLKSLNQQIDQLNKAMPFIDLCENVYQPLQYLLQTRWQNKKQGYEIECQLWQQCWQRQITLMTWRADKKKSTARCLLVNLDSKKPSLDYWLFYGLLLQSGMGVDTIDLIKDITSLNLFNKTGGLPVILFGDRRLNLIEIKQLQKFIKSWLGDTFCVGRMTDIHRELLTEFTMNYEGGSASQCWQSVKFEAWRTSIGQQ